MDYSAGMHTVEELQEMMELRKQMEALQLRYAAILERPLKASGELPPASSPTAPATSSSAAAPPVAPSAVAAAPAAPVPEKPAATAPAAPVAPAAPASSPTPPAAPAADAPKPGSLRESITAVLKAAGKPLSFDQIYAALEAGNYKLPEQKPKLVVRKTLFNKAAFAMVGKDKLGQGKYDIIGG